MKRALLPFLRMLLIVTIAGSAAAQNQAPSIAAGNPIYLSTGGPGSTATVGTVSDTEDSAGSLTVTADSVPSGISVSDITNNNGTVTATITIGCDAAAGANNVVFLVTD